MPYRRREMHLLKPCKWQKYRKIKKNEASQSCKQKVYTSLTLFVRKVYTFCKPPLDFDGKGTGRVIRASSAGRRQGCPYYGVLSSGCMAFRLFPRIWRMPFRYRGWEDRWRQTASRLRAGGNTLRDRRTGSGCLFRSAGKTPLSRVQSILSGWFG